MKEFLKFQKIMKELEMARRSLMKRNLTTRSLR